jgi:hypothetical protein
MSMVIDSVRSAGGARDGRARLAVWLCSVMLFFSAGGCGSGAGDDDAAQGGSSGSSGSSNNTSGSGGSGGTASDVPPDCGFTPVSTTRLPGKDVGSVRVVNGVVYYTHDDGLSKTTLGNQSATAAESLGTDLGGLYLNDTHLGSFRNATYPAGELVLFPLAGGEPIVQTVSDLSLTGGYSRATKTNTLYGVTDFLPFTYFTHDVTTGQEQTFTTTLMTRGVDDWVVGPNAIYVALADYDDLLPTDLYRIDKAGGDPVLLTTGIPVQFDVWGADSSYVYLWVDGGEGMEAYGPAMYQLPAAGTGAPVKIPLDLRHWATTRLHITEGATLIDFYDAFQTPYGNFTYRVGPSAADAATPVKVLDAHSCELLNTWSVGKTMYAVVEENDVEQWLYELPAGAVP